MRFFLPQKPNQWTILLGQVDIPRPSILTTGKRSVFALFNLILFWSNLTCPNKYQVSMRVTAPSNKIINHTSRTIWACYKNLNYQV